ncbi:hypothetical protein [Reichenbachiella ulvae]|uniref:Uncharacterized protein n=1 Tax=Reichenbachiella ulvae TaxID=2980104 RepID=A0ABT3CW81_9BACT|nr:hypothetical protein [Reichenbachiella ulvae]MCV9387862.1 hypothetical protein [Reichenbachiella ulvae]
MNIEIIYMSVLAVAIFIYYYRQHQKEKSPKKTESKARINEDGEHFLEALADHDYFRWTKEKTLDLLCDEIKRNYEQYGEISTIETNDRPACFRLYPADEEDLFEEGGFQYILPIIGGAFKKRKLKWEIRDFHENYQNNIANQWLVLNERKYIIYDQLDGKSAQWNLASEKLLMILNRELALQNSEERVYSIRGGNDHQIIFLNRAQFDFLRASNLREEDKPRTN